MEWEKETESKPSEMGGRQKKKADAIKKKVRKAVGS
jgi:hypothetical protein